MDGIRYRIQSKVKKSGVRDFTDYYRVRSLLVKAYGDSSDDPGLFNDLLPSDFWPVRSLQLEIEFYMDEEDPNVIVIHFMYTGE